MNYKYNKYKDKYNYLKILYGGTQIKLLIEKKLPAKPYYEFKYIGRDIVEKKIMDDTVEYKQQINLGDFFIRDDDDGDVFFLKSFVSKHSTGKPDKYRCIYIKYNMYLNRELYNTNCTDIDEDDFKTFQKLKFNKNIHNIALATQVLDSGFIENDEVYVGEKRGEYDTVLYKIIEIKNFGTDACVKLRRFSQTNQEYTDESFELFKLDISTFKHIDGRDEKYAGNATSGPYEVDYSEDDDKKTNGSHRVVETTSVSDKRPDHKSNEFKELSKNIKISIDNVINLLKIEKEKY